MGKSWGNSLHIAPAPHPKMKDRQGVMRGKCNECNECDEYVKPSEGARCDYCDHVPTQHVLIIKLGSCKKCDECSEYMSGEQFSYTDCEYCGCKPSEHQGAEKLRKKPPPTATAAGKVPVQSVAGATPLGGLTCKLPGCSKPRYSEHGKVHDFCGKGHAQKFQQTIIPSTSKMLTQPPPSSSIGQMPPSYISVMSTAKDGENTGPIGPPAVKMCYECQTHPANPGFNICQACFTHRKS